jgi:UDP-2,4-diacetamido-2,4,6-trideoxy-beta-L-altropyranose hydrolase
MYAEVNRRIRCLSPQIRSMFINLGGGDAGRFFPALLEGLRQWNPELEIVAARGFGKWGENSAGHSGMRWARPEEPVWELFFRSDAAITAGGLSSCEALCCGTPLLAMSYDSYQQTTVTTLAREGLCVDLGPGDSLKPSEIPQWMELLAGNTLLREKRSAEGRRRVDGRGAGRVSRIIQECLAGIAA